MWTLDSEAAEHGPNTGDTVQCPTLTTCFPWRKIWAIHTPNKVKHGRLVHNSLPLKRKIQRRGMEIDTRCTTCFRLDEDVGRLLFKCKDAKAIWRGILLEDRRSVLEVQSTSFDVFRQIWQWDDDTMLSKQ